MRSKLFILAMVLYNYGNLAEASAQSFTTPMSITANVGGVASGSDFAMMMSGAGSGINGPAFAQYGQNLACSKTNWKSAKTVGEIDCLNIFLRQGGPGSDSSGILVNAQNTGLGNISDLDLTASNLNVTTGVTPMQVNLRLGLITSQDLMYGAQITAQNGAAGSALYVNAEGPASWATVIQAAKLGQIYFRVDSNGNLTTSGKITTASLKTTGSVQAMGGVISPLPASDVLTAETCGTTLRSTSAKPRTLIVPKGLPGGCHIEVIQASAAAVEFKGEGMTLENAGSNRTGSSRTAGLFAEAELVIDSPTTFLVSGETTGQSGSLSKSNEDEAKASGSQRFASLH